MTFLDYEKVRFVRVPVSVSAERVTAIATKLLDFNEISHSNSFA